MFLSWIDVLGALVVSSILFSILIVFIPTAHGKAGGYLILGVVGLVGLIFSKFVKKEIFRIETCNNCEFSSKIKIEPVKDAR